jgi:hypothetical protein
VEFRVGRQPGLVGGTDHQLHPAGARRCVTGEVTLSGMRGVWLEAQHRSVIAGGIVQ